MPNDLVSAGRELGRVVAVSVGQSPEWWMAGLCAVVVVVVLRPIFSRL